jgi:acylphosphatase
MKTAPGYGVPSAASGPTSAASAEPVAIAGTVTGNVQKVGFRAMILKQAVEYNLAGSAINAGATVQFHLQGDKSRIDQALAVIRNGTKKSCNVDVSVSPAAVQPGLKTFTILGWTSNSRKIDNHYDMVFHLRADDQTVSKQDAKDTWHDILRTTLTGEDRKKLGDADE